VGFLQEDGEASPSCSGFSLGSLPLRRRSRKPKHVYNASAVRSPSPPPKPKPRKVRAPLQCLQSMYTGLHAAEERSRILRACVRFLWAVELNGPCLEGGLLNAGGRGLQEVMSVKEEVSPSVQERMVLRNGMAGRPKPTRVASPPREPRVITVTGTGRTSARPSGCKIQE
jgi:hypothetical protein